MDHGIFPFRLLYQNMRGWVACKQLTLIFPVLEAGGLRSDARLVRFWWEPSFWLVDSPFSFTRIFIKHSTMPLFRWSNHHDSAQGKGGIHLKAASWHSALWLESCQHWSCNRETKHHTWKVRELRFIMPVGPEKLPLQFRAPNKGITEFL